MYKEIIIACVIISIAYLIYCSYQKSKIECECELNLDKKYPNLRPSFKNKFCKIFTNQDILNKLQNEKSYSPEIYPNKLINLTDGTVIGLEYCKIDPIEYEVMLDDVENAFDDILKHQCI